MAWSSSFTFGVCMLAGLLFGLAPAFQLAATRLFESLKDRDALTATGRTQAIRNLLVVGEVALALVLLVSAGLLLQSFARLRGVDPGFRAENTLALSTSLPRSKYRERASRTLVVEELLQAVRAVPEIEQAASINEMPLADDRQGTSFYEQGQSVPEPGREQRTNFSFVSPGYFRVMGIPLLQGRTFTDRDRPDSPRAIVVNRALAERYFPDQDVVGKRLFVGFSMSEPWEIVGVVGDVRHNALAEDASPNVYGSYVQHPAAYGVSFVVKTASDPEAVTEEVRRAILSVDGTLPLFNVQSLSQVVDQSVSQPRFSSLLLGAFAAVALLLAAIGIYGVMSYSVTQRIPEIGVRVAMGAQRADILKLIVGGGVQLALVGVGVGSLELWRSHGFSRAFCSASTLTTYRRSSWWPLRSWASRWARATCRLAARRVSTPSRRSTTSEPRPSRREHGACRLRIGHALLDEEGARALAESPCSTAPRGAPPTRANSCRPRQVVRRFRKARPSSVRIAASGRDRRLGQQTERARPRHVLVHSRRAWNAARLASRRL